MSFQRSLCAIVSLLASSKEIMMLLLYYVESLCLKCMYMLEVVLCHVLLHAGHTVLALEIIKKCCLFSFGKGSRQENKKNQTFKTVIKKMIKL